MHILLIDDEPAILRLVSHTIRRIGHTVHPFMDSRAALATLSASIDLILCDVDMPGLDGFKLARDAEQRLGQKLPRLLLMSGASHADRFAASLPSRVIGLIHKPVEPDTLIRVLKFLELTRARCPGALRPLCPFVQTESIQPARKNTPVLPCMTAAYGSCPHYNTLCGQTLRLWIDPATHASTMP